MRVRCRSDARQPHGRASVRGLLLKYRLTREKVELASI